MTSTEKYLQGAAYTGWRTALALLTQYAFHNKKRWQIRCQYFDEPKSLRISLTQKNYADWLG